MPTVQAMVVLSAPTVHINNQPLLEMTSLNSKLQLARLNRKKGRHLIEKGFTLVELMIVIVIVGILSGVALPNFLSQSTKAKGTEAKSQISAILKSAASMYSESGAGFVTSEINAGDETCTRLGGPVSLATNFDYVCAQENLADDGEPEVEGIRVTATANENDTGIESNTVAMTLAFPTGLVVTDRANTSEMFGGTRPNSTPDT